MQGSSEIDKLLDYSLRAFSGMRQNDECCSFRMGTKYINAYYIGHIYTINAIMYTMLSYLDKEQAALVALGHDLRANRKRRRDTQADAADRCGVSRETYRKMEQGNPGVSVGNWIRAIRLYGDMGSLEALFPTSLFDQLTEGKR